VPGYWWLAPFVPLAIALVLLGKLGSSPHWSRGAHIAVRALVVLLFVVAIVAFVVLALVQGQVDSVI
jgi:hypothetical protein